MEATPDPTFPAGTDGIIDERFTNIGTSTEQVIEPTVLGVSEPAIDNFIGRNDEHEFEKLWLGYQTAKRQ